jgi:hypothetical protein
LKKTATSIFILLLSITLQAQTLKNTLDSVFMNVNKTDITTGLLDYCGRRIYKLDKLTGQSTDTAVINFSNWKDIYTSLASAYISNTYKLPTSTSSYLPLIQNQSAVGNVLIPILLYNYHTLKDSLTLTQCFTVSNNQFYDISNRPTSPYLQKTVFAAAPVVTNYSTRSIKLTLNTTLCYTNTGKTIQKLQIDFGQGFNDIISGQIINYNYNSDGEKTIIIKAIYSDNSEYQCKSKITINTNIVNFYTDEPTIKWLTATHANAGGYGCRIQILYGCGHTSIVKPLIIAEGFNPSVLTPNDPRGLDIQDFRIAMRDINLDNTTTGNRIDIDIQNDGYDIIYIDFNEGGGDIKKNAWLMREVIQWVNSEKVKNNSIEKNIVLGQSMGGLAARYALCKMEQLNENHQTSKYISFDAPHLGANIPLSYQTMISYIYNNLRDDLPSEVTGYIENAWSALNCDAAKQMMIYHLGNAANSLFTSLQSEFQTMGFPSNCENIGIANGNSNGLEQEFSPGQLLLHLHDGGWPLIDMKAYALKDNFTSTPETVFYGKITFDLLLFNYVHNESTFKYNYTRPYDSAPGGKYDLRFFGIDPDNLGFSPEALINSFCFVPTVSALAITSEINNPYYSFGNIDITPSGLNKTNFKITATFQDYPNAVNNNDPHTFFTFGNDEILRNNVFFQNQPTTIADPILSNSSTYTYGKSSTNETPNRMDFSFVLYKDRIMNINTNDIIGYSTHGNTISNSTFSLELVACNGQTNTLTVFPGAKLNIGDGSTRTGILTLRNNTVLYLKSGAELSINNLSNLIIDNGAILKYEKGAIIKLNHTNSVLIAKHGGKIQIGTDAQFNYSGDGFIRFETGYPISSSIEAIGSNAQFKLVGGSFGSTSKKLMEITGGQTLSDLTTFNSPAAAFNLRLFSIQNGNIVLDANSRIVVGGTNTIAQFRSVDIKAAIDNNLNERHRGIVVNGQNGNSFYKVNITDAITGINSLNFYGGNDITMLQVTATRCKKAIYIWGAGANLNDIRINNCETAIDLVGMSRSTRLYKLDLFYNSVGVNALNCINNIIELYDPHIWSNYYGLYGDNSQFTAKCGIIKNSSSSSLNSTGKYDGANVYLTNNSNLVLDPIMRPTAGKIDMSNYRSVSVRQQSAGYGPYINQSSSSLFTDIDYSIFGTLAKKTSSTLNYPSKLPANNNLWSYSNGISNSPTRLVDYKTQYQYSFIGLLNIDYEDLYPINTFNSCYPNTASGGGDEERMRGFINGTVTPIKDLPNKQLADGSMLKGKIQEGYNYFFDLSPNYEQSVTNLTYALNTEFSTEDLNNWHLAIPLINSQLIEALSEGIHEGNISKFEAGDSSYSLIVQNVINLQDKLLIDFAGYNELIFTINISKASLLRMLEDRSASILVLNNIDSSLYPEMNNIKESYTCMIMKEKMLIDGSISITDLDLINNCLNQNFSSLIPNYDESDSGNELTKKDNNNSNANSFISFPIQIYPNPSNGIFNIKFKGQETTNYSIEIVDIIGKKVYNSKGIILLENNIQLNLNFLNSGTYFLKMVNGNDAQIKQLVIVK